MRSLRVMVLALALAIGLVPLEADAQRREDAPTIRGEVNGRIIVADGERLDALGAAFSNVEIDGTIVEIAVLVECETIIRGLVEGDLYVIGGSIRIEESAVILGQINIAEGSFFGDNPIFENDNVQWGIGPGVSREFTLAAAWLSLASWGGTSLLAIVAAIVFAGIGGRQLWSSAALITSRPVQSILAILALWFIAAILIVVLFISVLGIPVAGALMLVLTFVWMLGYLAVATRLGAALTRRSMSDTTVTHPYLPAIVGVVILQAIAFVPVLVTLILGLSGFDGLFDVSPMSILLLSAWWSATAVIWLIGTIGAGAITYRAFQAWRSTGASAPA